MSEKISLEGQRVIVTGSGRGLGRAHALLLGSLGARVVVNDLERSAADDVVAEINGAGGEAIASYDAVGTQAAGQAIVEVAMANFGGLDALVNNAGNVRPALFPDMTCDDFESVLHVHLLGSIYTTQAAWPIFQKQQYGRVVMTGSSSGMFSHPGMANYSAAKAGIFGLAKALAYEGLDYGIGVNTIMPVGLTDITQGRPIPTMAENYAKFVGPDLRQKINDIAQSGPEMVAHMVAYLVSRDCEFTGETYSALRGRYARVFVGVADGWLTRKGDDVSVETIADHMPQIRDISQHSVPKWAFEETRDFAERL